MCNISAEHLRPLHYPILASYEMGIAFTVLTGGILFNVFTIYALTQTVINSVLSKTIFYNQCVFDVIVCVMAIFQLAWSSLQPDMWTKTNAVFCHLVQSGFFLRWVRVLALGNIVCQSMNRFWAIVYPYSYKRRTKMYLVICYVFTFSFSLMSSLPRAFEVRYCDQICVMTNLAVQLFALHLIDMSMRLLIPIFVTVGLHIVVMRKLRRLRNEYNSQTRNCPENSDSSRGPPSSVSSNPYSAVWHALSVSTFGFTAELTVLELTAFIMYLLQGLNRVNFQVDSIARLYYTLVCAMASGLNPALEIATVPPLQEYVSQMVISVWSVLNTFRLPRIKKSLRKSDYVNQ
ncbi:unnamed protein product [Echinostoma caproni]|uniref:G_PROTEIN_RECEP_F1_2 domain-containing protein n=1 Tax=Echinostoma caproni TaxID=27848 RepID=A0A183A6Q1_9TREM|nr:unnamed protein product [Echinostoma caproni]